MVMERCYTCSKIKLLDKKEACACYNRSIPVMTALYVSSVKSSQIAYEGLKCNYYQENFGNLSRIA